MKLLNPLTMFYAPTEKLFVCLSKGGAVYIYFTNMYSSSQYLFCESLEGLLKLTLFSVQHWSVPLHVSPKRTWVRADKVTLVAFVRFFPAVCFQMFPQIACLRGGIVTLVAFV